MYKKFFVVLLIVIICFAAVKCKDDNEEKIHMINIIIKDDIVSPAISNSNIFEIASLSINITTYIPTFACCYFINFSNFIFSR